VKHVRLAVRKSLLERIPTAACLTPEALAAVAAELVAMSEALDKLETEVADAGDLLEAPRKVPPGKVMGHRPRVNINQGIFVRG
jgi:hypothetical protein